MECLGAMGRLGRDDVCSKQNLVACGRGISLLPREGSGGCSCRKWGNGHSAFCNYYEREHCRAEMV